jgi:hypothetical protein
MKNSEKSVHRAVRPEADKTSGQGSGFKKIGIGAVAAAAHAMRPQKEKEEAIRDVPSVLRKEHFIA